MVESPVPATASTPQVIEFARTSWQSYLIAGLLRCTLRPLAAVWPCGPRGARALDRVLDAGASVALLVHGRAMRDTARRLDVAGVPVLRVRAATVTAPERTILHFHGGGFVFGTAKLYREFALRLSAAADAEVLLFDYRHPPFTDVDTMIADCLTVYRWAATGYAPGRLAVSGDSAGSNLMFATVAGARSAGLPLPTAVAAQSGWLDMELPRRRWARQDPLFSVPFARRAARRVRAGGPIPPVLCPLRIDPAGLPPVLLQLGRDEPIRAANEAMADHLAAAGVPVRLELWAFQAHVFQLFGEVLPEGRAAIAAIAAFLDETSGSARPRSA
ncbi:alpha/beta hydrolase fold domain-containing protein [Nocardia sp. 2]|uniref:Alpha/beta hydrolase fold domain-containing protein n=1 Tax=Nocardia acididurans TaxID=2802282 RepID=A0ABS1M608_9NOCA|nr:alpha/beta hydrolase [Nocardia acididurans]MBL1076006.1 alpha/beta hydrolase fold domain-containing protein [Nocardia acididurans]